MAKLGLISLMASVFGLMASTQVASAESLTEEIGLTATTVISLGWLGLLTLLAIAIILPLVRR
jgi:hypothetical protein